MSQMIKHVSIVRSFIVVFRSAKEQRNSTFAERKATPIYRMMLGWAAILCAAWLSLQVSMALAQDDSPDAKASDDQPAAAAQQEPAADNSAADNSIAGDVVEIFENFFKGASKPADDESEIVTQDESKATQTDERIEPLSDFAKATSLAKLEQRPMLVVLGATWCSWCRKVEGELDTKEADSILKRWIVVKVDVDANPELAEKLDANALPSLRIVGNDQAAIAARQGYLPLAELEAWLDENLTAADPAIQRVLYASGTLDQDALVNLRGLMGHRSVAMRIAAQERIANSRSDSAGFVVDTLRTGSLAQQLCAVEILEHWRAPLSAVDPWSPESINADSLAPLLEWVQTIETQEPASESERTQGDSEATEIDA